MEVLARDRFRRSAIGLVTIVAFLFVGTAPYALAASAWPTWPPKKEAPAAETPAKPPVPGEPAKEEAAAEAGRTAGKSAFAGISAGTIGWAALIVGAGVGIAVAVGGGGGGGGSTTTSHHP